MRPGPLMSLVVAVWTFVPALVAPPKIAWALTGVLLALVANAVWRHAGSLRWSTPLTMLTVVYACATLSLGHYGTVAVLAGSVATSLLVLGCCLLGSNSGRQDITLFVRSVVVLAMAQLAVALCSAHLGLAAPWGYQGQSGTTFETNLLVPALGGRSTGTMAHAIPFGTLMAVAVVLSVTGTTRWPRVLRLATAAAASYGVAMSGSRSAAVAVVLTLAAALLTPGVLRIGPAWRTVAALALAVPMLVINTTQLTVVTSLQGTGSLTHRMGALDAAVRLTDRPFSQTLLGSGADSLKDLFAAGLLQLDGFFAVDNQFVTTFAVAGLIGLVALVGAVVFGLWRGDRATRPAALLGVLMFLSFDVLEWNSTAALCTLLLVLGCAHRRTVPGTADADDDPAEPDVTPQAPRSLQPAGSS